MAPQVDNASLKQGVCLRLTSNFWCKVDTFYRFTRPHTIIGSIVGITSVSLLPLVSVGDLSPAFFAGLLKVMIPIVCMNIYVVGLNQLYDVEIDKVNKPDLPIASGEYSMEMGKAIVSAFGLMSIIMGFMFQSPPVLFCLLICFFFGTAYSIDVPFFRWKKNAFLAAMCIVIVRAITVQLTVFYHIQVTYSLLSLCICSLFNSKEQESLQQYVLGRPVIFSRSLAFAIICMTLFVTVIALFKDIPDVEGDRDHGIQTISVTLGKKRVFWLCITILLIAYGSAVVIGASSSFLLSKLVTVTGHCILASILWLRANSVNLESNTSITSFYMFIWKLFYAEYLLIPFVR
nr:PREDICTED: homogentisate phytyltransferase 1, chloroplastic-like isoform X2 [Daucus carota subsp. sativus]